MKELSIEEKARAYDEIIKKANKMHHENCEDCQMCIEELIPELAESEDERIRKAIINVFAAHKDYEIFFGVSVEDILAWLEKQGAKVSAIEGFESEFERQVSGLIASTINKEHEYNQGYVKWTANALLNYAKHELEKQGKQKTIDNLTPQEAMDIAVTKCFEQDEQKPADKAELKFKVGDWIVFNGLILYIDEIVDGYYRTTSIGGIPNSYDWDINNIARLWTIQDAKDGDVLVCEDFGYISLMLFESFSNGRISLYCWHNSQTNNFHINTDAAFRKDANIYPATKEQRDTFEKAMTDAGYVFDFEKKELKKIEQKSTWSEEDKNMLKWVTGYLDNKMLNTPIVEERTACKNAIAWLEKLKDEQKPNYCHHEVDLELIIGWFEHIAQIADDRMTLTGQRMTDSHALDEIRCLVKKSSEFITKYYKAQKGE